jgi:hypothetical protein
MRFYTRRGSQLLSLCLPQSSSVALQGDLRQYVNDLLLKTGGVAAPGNPVITCKLYPVRTRLIQRLRA